MIFNPSTVREGFPCCHAYCADTRDGQDLLVGIANGEGEGMPSATQRLHMHLTLPSTLLLLCSPAALPPSQRRAMRAHRGDGAHLSSTCRCMRR
jgi:hypothetical protein